MPWRTRRWVSDVTHTELVARAAKWLGSQGCVAVVTEMVTKNRETPDALGWASATKTVLIECKTSRSDFLADRRKGFRKDPVRGMGLYRYYMVPRGLVTVDDLPEGWGLLEVTANKVFVVLKPRRFLKRNTQGETRMMISALRRLGLTAVEGVSVRPYRFSNKNTATLGVLEEKQ